jgi:hypothetical protein
VHRIVRGPDRPRSSATRSPRRQTWSLPSWYLRRTRPQRWLGDEFPVSLRLLVGTALTLYEPGWPAAAPRGALGSSPVAPSPPDALGGGRSPAGRPCVPHLRPSQDGRCPIATRFYRGGRPKPNCSARCAGRHTEKERARWIRLRWDSRRPSWPQLPSPSSTGSASSDTFLPSAPYSIMKPLGDQA